MCSGFFIPYLSFWWQSWQWRTFESSCLGGIIGCANSRNILDIESRFKKGKKMAVMQEFKEFAIKGNVVDLAVGVIIGAAFSKIVDSVVSDLILPIVGAVVGKLDFSNLFIVLGTVPQGTATTLDALRKAGVPVFAYGNFITVAVNFASLAFIIFLMVKQINRLKRREVVLPTAAAPAENIVLLREIRDSLKR